MPASAQCPTWDGPFGLDGFDGTVETIIRFDDGSGDALYAGGAFTDAFGVAAQHVARFDGATWSEVGGGMDGLVQVLKVLDFGQGPQLYAGGSFSIAGGATAKGIARWNGNAWIEVGGGVTSAGNFTVYDLEVYDDGLGAKLYVTGSFTAIGGVPALSIARWDGASWQALDSGLGIGFNWVGIGRALEVFDGPNGPSLYVGGDFEYSGPLVNSPGLARWDATGWHDIGGGGLRTSTSWGRARALHVFDDGSGPALFVGGQFVGAGGVVCSSVARWRVASGFSPLGVGFTLNSFQFGPWRFAEHDEGAGPRLYACGAFSVPGSQPPATHTARWNGSTWEGLDIGMFANIGANAVSVRALASFDAGDGEALYAGGDFLQAAYTCAGRIARWKSGAWQQIGTNRALGMPVNALLATDEFAGVPELYAAGEFLTTGSGAAGRVARWDGANWQSLANGPSSVHTNHDVYALAVYDSGSGPELYATGAFSQASGGPLDGIARWNGSAWSGVGGGMVNSWGTTMQVFDAGLGAELFVGGYLTSVGGVTVQGIARWNGTSWNSVSGGLWNSAGLTRVWDLEPFDDGSGVALYAIGQFNLAGGTSVSNIAKWNGSQWSGVGASGLSGVGYSLAVHDDGSGPALYAGGGFTQAGGVPAVRVARWDGSSWSAVGSGADGLVRKLHEYDFGDGPELVACGQFTSIGGVTARVARWNGSSWSAVATTAGGWLSSLATFDDGSAPWPQLFAGGYFSDIDGAPSSSIARLSDPCACEGVSYCTAGTTMSSCTATMSSTGSASRSQSSGFVVTVSNVEGHRDGVIFFSTTGAAALPWGNGTSVRCALPPLVRTGVQDGIGDVGTCDNVYTLDFNAWMNAHAAVAPAAGTTAYLQAWFRDPGNGSNQDTSFSNGLRVRVCP